MSAAHDTTLIVDCPKCRAVMWQGSSMCQRCRDAADTVISEAELTGELGEHDDDPPPYRPRQKRLRGGLES